jgi:hypothetical protein
MEEINNTMPPSYSYFEEFYFLGYKAWKSTHVLTEHQLTFTGLQSTPSQKKLFLATGYITVQCIYLTSRQMF